jgi:hypothetical protein
MKPNENETRECHPPYSQTPPSLRITVKQVVTGCSHNMLGHNIFDVKEIGGENNAVHVLQNNIRMHASNKSRQHDVSNG